MFIGNKKCRIYAACGVSQTPRNIEKMRGKFNELIKDAWEVLDEHLE